MINSGDTAWMLIASALVMLMTPAGLTLFYGGLTQRKSVLNTIGMSYTAFCTASVVWLVLGYSIAFSGDGAYFGNLDNFLLKGILVTDVEGTIPTLLFVFFQGTFAAIAVALVSGSIIERVRYSTWFVFSILWVILVSLKDQIFGRHLYFLVTLARNQYLQKHYHCKASIIVQKNPCNQDQLKY